MWLTNRALFWFLSSGSVTEAASERQPVAAHDALLFRRMHAGLERAHPTVQPQGRWGGSHGCGLQCRPPIDSGGESREQGHPDHGRPPSGAFCSTPLPPSPDGRPSVTAEQQS